MIGYTDYDHAGWVEGSIAAYRQNLARAEAEAKTAGRAKRAAAAPTKGWLTAPVPLPAWQRRAMDVLGMTFGGIYNAPITWDTVDWGAGRHLHVPITSPMATFDNPRLTAFVFLCHEAGIRGLIAPHSPRHLRLSMWERQRQGDTAARHPPLHEAVADFLQRLAPTHRVRLEHETQLADLVEAAARHD